MQTDPPTPHLSETVLHAWLDDALDAAARNAADAHLATCATCAARLAELRQVAAMLDSWSDAPLERDLSAGVLAAIAPRRIAVSARWRAALAAQIAGALIAGGGLALALQNGLVAPAIPEVDVLAPLTTLGSWVTALASQQFALTASAASSALQLLNTPLFSAGVCLSIAGVAWIIGNSALLRGAVTAHTGKKS